jgi:hypothetical protein
MSTDRITVLKKIETLLVEWEKVRGWGEILIEVKDGVPTLFKATTQQKLNSHQLGGLPHARHDER